jgi:hypothetical protein
MYRGWDADNSSISSFLNSFISKKMLIFAEEFKKEGYGSNNIKSNATAFIANVFALERRAKFV